MTVNELIVRLQELVEGNPARGTLPVYLNGEDGYNIDCVEVCRELAGPWKWRTDDNAMREYTESHVNIENDRPPDYGDDD
jgi:hypothetical protein